MGYNAMQLKARYEGIAPQIANEIDRGSRKEREKLVISDK
jgi:hypothetical protein